jgi:hypothetical protein
MKEWLIKLILPYLVEWLFKALYALFGDKDPISKDEWTAVTYKVGESVQQALDGPPTKEQTKKVQDYLEMSARARNPLI